MMRKNTPLLLMIAVLAIGIFALPQSVALFSGQHSWYNLTPQGNDVPCEKCHGDIASEIASSGAHKNIECGGCHRADARVGYAGDWEGDVDPGQGAHAASTIECMICHDRGTNFTHHNIGSDECSDCHTSPFVAPGAGGFNLTDPSVLPSDTGTKAAHMQFVHDAINETLMEGANEACIACHTHVGVNITWTKNVVLNFEASENETGSWSIPDFSATGDNVTESNYTNTWVNP
ncbi:MAG: hypothetical protein OCU18_06540 [Candidatus Syntrophoarchaeum sp.]|nr:hypothetical protein [Candidatus Syntrophoarchaeum sp.]